MSAFVLLCRSYLPAFLADLAPALAGVAGAAGVATCLVAVEAVLAVFAFAIHNYLHYSKLCSTVLRKNLNFLLNHTNISTWNISILFG